MRDRWRRGSRRARLLGRALGAVAALCLGGGAVALAGAGLNGAPGVGDPFFPDAGNGGYEVDHYDLNISYRRHTGGIYGHERISATASENLARFDLDLRPGFHIKELQVNGEQATHNQTGQELQITPAAAISDGDPIKVNLRYSGRPHTVTDPDGSPDGWIPTDDGVWIASEPQGAPSWFAANDTPADKATFEIAVTVPRGLKAVSNGDLFKIASHSKTTTWHWRENTPMATYLATATIGKFHVKQSSFDHLRSYVAVDSKVKGYGKTLAKIPAMIRFFESKYGPYPFRDVGAIVDPSSAGYSLETQTRPLLPGKVDELTLAHELSHQWFGDSVGLTRWPDIWLNEGFAGFSESLWGQHAGGESLRKILKQTYATPASDDGFWNPPPGNPGDPEHLFDGTVYIRGAMTLEALRETIGSGDFYKTLRTWAREHRHGHGTTPQFIQTAEDVSGKDLGHFFHEWLFASGKPPADVVPKAARRATHAAPPPSLSVHR
jgi:aminopeptidase N